MAITHELARTLRDKVISPVANGTYSVLTEYASKGTIDERIQRVQDLVDTQGTSGNWDYDHYMHGLYNGMELALATVQHREPEFLSAPAQWIREYNDAVPDIAIETNIELREAILFNAHIKKSLNVVAKSSPNVVEDYDEPEVVGATPEDNPADWAWDKETEADPVDMSEIPVKKKGRYR